MPQHPTFAAAPPAPRRLLAIATLAAGLAAGFTGTVQAAPIPFAEREIQLTARELPVARFLQDLFGMIDVPVVVSEKAQGAVNGSFRGDAETIWARISRSFNLVGYYDGAVLHVVTPNELSTRTLPLNAGVAARITRIARELRMPDSRHTLRTTAEGTLVATGSRRFIEQVEELARGQTAATAARPPQGFEVHFLRYAWAHDVSVGFGGKQVTVPGVASIVRALMTGQSASQIQVSPNEQRQAPTVPKLKGQGLISHGSSPNAPAAATEGGSVAALLAAYAAEKAPGGVGSGDPGLMAAADPAHARVEADTRLNAIIVRDAPDRLPQYKQLIQALDVEPQALEIEARIIDIDTDKMRELGINWRLGSSRGSFLFGNGSNSDLALNGSTPPGQITPQGQGGFLSAVLGGGNELALRINALQEQGAAKVVSSPQVLTLSNVEAVFDTSRTFYVRVAGREEVDLFSVSAGTTLRVTPHVFRDGNDVRIKLLVAIDDGNLSGAQVDAIPIVDRATISTQALIFEGESLLIGGLTREATTNGVTKVPFLGDIPIIGHLFKSTAEGSRRTERLFLIAPRLVPARRSAALATPGAPPAGAPAATDLPPTAPAPQAPPPEPLSQALPLTAREHA
jgi:type III secretion protein C